TLLTILLVSLSFLGFGESPFTMRLANLAYDAAAVGFLFLVVDRLVSRRAAWVAGVLAAIPSPGYLMVGSIVWASHVEANAFAAALLWFWYRTVFRERASGSSPADSHAEAPRFRAEFGLGVLAGFSIWFHYGLLVWLAVMLVTEFIRRPASWVSAPMGVRVIGFAVGLAPWWHYNLGNGWKGLGVYGKSASAHFQTDAETVAETFERLVTHFLPHSLYLPPWNGWGPMLEAAITLAGVLAWLALSVREVRRWRSVGKPGPLLAVALYPPLWTVLYTFGTFHGQDYWVSGYRYMLPLHPVAWISFAALGGNLRPGWRRGSFQVLTAAAVCVFLAGIVHFLQPSAIRTNWEGPGYHPASVARLLLVRRGEDPEGLKESLERCLQERDPMETDIVHFVLGNSLLFKANETRLPKWAGPEYAEELRRQREAHRASMDELRDHVPERFKPYFTRFPEGQRPFGWSQRDAFWRQWERLGQKRPEGAYSY
ncbi:MAG: hypothetical protein AAGG01_20165, partial [Planctomycetota bacterium]